MVRLLLAALAVVSYCLPSSLAQAASRAQQEAWPSIADLLGRSPLAPFIPQVRSAGCRPLYAHSACALSCDHPIPLFATSAGRRAPPASPTPPCSHSTPVPARRC